MPSPYPAGAQLFFRAVATVHESVFAFNIAFAVCDFAIVLVLLSVLRHGGQAEHWVLAYAWHPLLAMNARSSHVDILGVLLLLVSVAALGRGWRAIAAITFALSVAVKFLPIVLIPLYWRRLRIRDGLLAAIVFGLLYLAILERVASPRIVAGLAVLVGLVIAGWLRSKQPTSREDGWAWPMGASLACAPVIYPWYLLWLLPFMRSRTMVPLIIWTISIMPTYLVWYLRSLGRVWQVPGWVLLLEYGSVATAAAIMSLRPLAQPVLSKSAGTSAK